VFLYYHYGIVPTKIYCGFGECFNFFVVDEHILLFVTLIELLGFQMLSLLFVSSL
jgi:hypothetical protein